VESKRIWAHWIDGVGSGPTLVAKINNTLEETYRGGGEFIAFHPSSERGAAGVLFVGYPTVEGDLISRKRKRRNQHEDVFHRV
jgi:hypothetical protein